MNRGIERDRQTERDRQKGDSETARRFESAFDELRARVFTHLTRKVLQNKRSLHTQTHKAVLPRTHVKVCTHFGFFLCIKRQTKWKRRAAQLKNNRQRAGMGAERRRKKLYKKQLAKNWFNLAQRQHGSHTHVRYTHADTHRQSSYNIGSIGSSGGALAWAYLQLRFNLDFLFLICRQTHRYTYIYKEVYMYIGMYIYLDLCCILLLAVETSDDNSLAQICYVKYLMVCRGRAGSVGVAWLLFDSRGKVEGGRGVTSQRCQRLLNGQQLRGKSFFTMEVRKNQKRNTPPKTGKVTPFCLICCCCFSSSCWYFGKFS